MKSDRKAGGLLGLKGARFHLMAMAGRNDVEATVTSAGPQTTTGPAFGRLGPVGDPVQAHESELIARTIQGDSESFYDLVRPYERSVFLAAVSVVQNPADAEDVAQDAILKAFKNLSRFRQESKFSTWLIQITLNEAKMWLRKHRHHLYESLNDEQQEDGRSYIPRDFADWRPIPSEALEQTEVREVLNKAVQSLPAKYRSVLFFRDVQQFSIKETAEILGLTITTVKTRLSRARLRLRDALAPGFGGSWS
jgi:RNA polymerase sigma-70 factor (ECF subfamily)